MANENSGTINENFRSVNENSGNAFVCTDQWNKEEKTVSKTCSVLKTKWNVKHTHTHRQTDSHTNFSHTLTHTHTHTLMQRKYIYEWSIY